MILGSRHPSFGRLANQGMATQLHQNRRGDWWVTTRSGAYRFRGPAFQLEVGRRHGARHEIPQRTEFTLSGILEDAAGRIWIVSRRGLFRSDKPKRGPPVFAFLPLVGLEERDEITDLVSDRPGNI